MQVATTLTLEQNVHVISNTKNFSSLPHCSFTTTTTAAALTPRLGGGNGGAGGDSNQPVASSLIVWLSTAKLSLSVIKQILSLLLINRLSQWIIQIGAAAATADGACQLACLGSGLHFEWHKRVEQNVHTIFACSARLEFFNLNF